MIESMAESVVPNWAAIRLNRLTYIPDHTCVKGPRQDSSAFLRKIYLNDNYQLCYTFFTNIFLKKHKQSSKKGQIKCECTSLYRQNAAITLLWNHLVLTQLEITCYYQCSDLLIRVLQQCKKLKKKKNRDYQRCHTSIKQFGTIKAKIIPSNTCSYFSISLEDDSLVCQSSLCIHALSDPNQFITPA